MVILCMKTHLVMLILLLTLVAIAPLPVFANQTDAVDAISLAKSTILDCYNAAKQAETAGANITTLVDTLNKASSLLSQAEFAYATSDFNAALNLAVRSQNSLNGFVAEASALKETATVQVNQNFLLSVIGSIIGTFAIMIGGFAAWRFIKKKYTIAGVPK